MRVQTLVFAYFPKISESVYETVSRAWVIQSSLPMFCACMGMARVKEQITWDDDSVPMIWISENTYTGVDSAES